METPTLHSLTTILSTPTEVIYPKKKVIIRKLYAGALLFVFDVMALSLAISLGIFLRYLMFTGSIELDKYLSLTALVLVLLPLSFYLRGLYPGFGIDVIEELRSLTYLISIVYAVVGSATFIAKGQWEYSRAMFLISWIISIPAVPLFRSLARKIFAHKDWWGIPVIILGAGNAGEKVIKSLKKHYQVGLRPIVAVDDDIDRWGYIQGVPVIGGLDVVPELAKKLSVENAIIAMTSIPRKRLKDIINNYSKCFDNLIVISDLFGLSSLWVSTKVIGGFMGLEVQKRLLKKSSYIRKRIFDLALATSIGIIALPFLLIISLLIYLDSKGKIFFKQERMGINDSRFNIAKFRTMHTDAEKRLYDVLSQNDALRREYEIYHKMRNDPRLTRIGQILRKFSLDELPQFWNVIKGEMSLIGPRAYLPWEKKNMHSQDEIILQVKPGISGLWQVTDRNDSSFEERLFIDVYYIRNWSMFMDFYILARTLSVVFLGRGGY